MRPVNFRIVAAVGTALAATCGTSVVHALNQPTTAGIAADHKLIIAGASAMRDAVEAALQNTMCSTGTFTRYRVTTGNSPDLRAYSCSLKNGSAAVTDSLEGDNVVYYYRSEGGSIYGPGSVVKSMAIARLDVNTTNCSAADGSNFLCAVTGYTLADDGATATGAITHTTTMLAVSDVEPAMFTGPNWPGPGESVLGDEPDPALLSGLTAVPVLAQNFGLLVSSTFPVTNLTREDAVGIFSGNYGDWSQVKGSGTSGTITVCRRERGSGTQAAANLYFMGQNCSPSPVAFVHSVDNPPLSSIVIENSTTAALLACVTSNPNAIGLSVGNAPPAGEKFVTINGRTTNPLEAAKGDYDYWYEATMAKRPGLTGTLGIMADDLIAAAQSDASLPNVASVMALAGIGGNVAHTAPLVAGTTKPIALGRRGGNSGNSCSVAVPVNAD